MTKAQDSEVLPLKDRLVDLVFRHEVCEEGSSNVSYELNSLQTIIEYKERRDEVATRFPKQESDYIASLILQKLDSHFRLHCDEICCGKEYRFAPVRYSNKGCSEIMSRIHIDSLDEKYPYKIYMCPCGDIFPKHELSKHQSIVCKLRDLSSSFANIGCMKITKACDVNQHITEDVTSHLLLTVNRMMEYEKQMRKMHIKITSLENQQQRIEKIPRGAETLDRQAS